MGNPSVWIDLMTLKALMTLKGQIQGHTYTCKSRSIWSNFTVGTLIRPYQGSPVVRLDLILRHLRRSKVSHRCYPFQSLVKFDVNPWSLFFCLPPPPPHSSTSLSAKIDGHLGVNGGWQIISWRQIHVHIDFYPYSSLHRAIHVPARDHEFLSSRFTFMKKKTFSWLYPQTYLFSLFFFKKRVFHLFVPWDHSFRCR